MYHWPAKNGILPRSPERAEFIREHGFGDTVDPRNVRPALKPKDRDRIDIDDPLDVRYWTSALMISGAELEAAVRAVGRETVAVRRWLAG